MKLRIELKLLVNIFENVLLAHAWALEHADQTAQRETAKRLIAKRDELFQLLDLVKDEI